MSGGNRRKESRRLLTVLISKQREVTGMGGERRREAELLNVWEQLVKPAVLMTAAPYKTRH